MKQRCIIRVKNRARVLLLCLLSHACIPNALTRKFMNDKPQTLQRHNSVKLLAEMRQVSAFFLARYATRNTSGRLKETLWLRVFPTELRVARFEKIFFTARVRCNVNSY